MSADKTGARIRAEAARVVDAVVSDGRSLDAALAAATEFPNPADAALLRHLSYGVLRNYWRLCDWQNALLKRRLRKRDSLIQALVCLGLYQLTDTRVPDHAVVSMTVEAARQLRQPKFAALINALLRNFRRQDMAALEPSDDESRFNHPGWMLEQLQRDWPQHWQDIAAANNERAPMWLRANTRFGTAEEYLQRLSTEVAEPHTLLAGLDSALCLSAPQLVADLPGFASGQVSVQDAAAQIAGVWLGGGENLRILDACAAPGGKTGHLLELSGPGSTLTAVDSDAGRLQRVAENLDRLELDATLIAADASMAEEWWDMQPFERILLDAPCSASGVVRRHPDIKMLRRPSDLERLGDLQQKLLRSLWPLLAPGGRLLYVTCSVFARENDEQIATFLRATADAREDRLLPNNNIRDLMIEKESGYQILPGTRGLDGFYYACLEKVC